MNSITNAVDYNGAGLVVAAIRENRYSKNTEEWQRDVNAKELLKDKVKFFVAKEPIFTMEQYPDKIFKMVIGRGTAYKSSPCSCPSSKPFVFDSNRARYTNGAISQEIINTFSNPKIGCPKVAIVKANYEEVVVEDLLEFDPDMKAQEELYNSDDKALDKTIKQFAKFILMTGYADVKVENNPLSENIVKVVDLEHFYKPCSEMDSCSRKLIGIFGGGPVSTNKGLMNIVSKRHAELVTDVCRKHFGIQWSKEWEDRAQRIVDRRN